MFWTIVMEILILWVCYAAYMAVLVHRRGPISGIFFYPQVMIDRVKALGLITEAEFRSRKRFAFTLLIAWMLVIPGVMILGINGARTYWDCCWQFYALFLGAEFFDWLFIDTIWVALSRVKQWKLLKLIPFSVPLAAAVGGLYWLIGRMM